MKPIVNQKSQSIRLGTGILAIMLLFVISSCATQTSNLGKTAPKNQVLPLAVDANTKHAPRHCDCPVFKDVIKQYYEQTNKEFGTDYKPPK